MVASVNQTATERIRRSKAGSSTAEGPWKEEPMEHEGFCGWSAASERAVIQSMVPGAGVGDG